MSETATWQEIWDLEDRQDRAMVAKALGWAEDPQWVAEARRLGVDEYPSWRVILELVLGLDQQIVPASAAQIVERISELRSRPADWTEADV